VAITIVWRWLRMAAGQAREARAVVRLRAAANAAAVVLPEAVEAGARLAEVVVGVIGEAAAAVDDRVDDEVSGFSFSRI
jgi:hypothetical protein